MKADSMHSAIRRGISTVAIVMASCGIWPVGGRLHADAIPLAHLRELASHDRERLQASHFLADGELESRKSELHDLSLKLDRYLSTLAGQEADWRSFLRYDELQAELNKPQPDPSTIREIGRRHAASAVLLKEYGSFPSMADALAGYAQQLSLAVTTVEEVHTKLDELLSCLPALGASSERAMKSLVGIRGWLEERNLAPDLCNAVDSLFRRPNVIVEFSEGILDTLAGTSGTSRNRISETVLGTRYLGESTTNWTLTPRLVAMTDQFGLEFRWTAKVRSRTQGVNGTTTIRSQATTEVIASKLVRVGQQGWTLQPTVADATVSSTILDVSTAQLLGRRIAASEVYRQKPATEREFARRAEAEARTGLDRSVGRLTQEIEDRIVRNVAVPLMIRDQFPTGTEVSTGPTWTCSFLLANRFQCGSTVQHPQPAMDLGSSDAMICVHCSAIHNLCSGMLAGRTLSEAELAKQFREQLGWAPAGISPQQADRTWTIEFQADSPLRLSIDDGALSIQIRAERLMVGDRTIPGSWITATYRLGVDEGRLFGERQGALEIIPAGYDAASGTRLGARYQVFRSMLRQRFERILGKQFHWDGIALPREWARSGSLRCDRIRAVDEWLAVSFRIAKE